HIVRCKMLLFVLDMAASDGRDPISDYQSLRKELGLYDPLLLKKKFAVIANKADLAESAENTKIFKRKYPKVRVVEISALEKSGLSDIFQDAEI
ncbi:MAG: GTPase ObgE, partial [Verrucomicrobiota bacterium]